MAIVKDDHSLILKLLLAIFAGAFLGMFLGANAEQGYARVVMNVVVALRHILEQVIFFLVPLVIVGFITPAIVRIGQNASRMLLAAVGIAYLSSLAAALFAMGVGCLIVLALTVPTIAEPLRTLPDIVFQLDIPPLLPVLSSMCFALLFGVATALSRAELFSRLFTELERIVSALINVVFIPLLPVFVGLSFLSLAYEGLLSIHLPVFLSLVLVVVCCHFLWLAVLYGLAALVSGRNPFEVFRHFLPAYLTAVGTMSSVATLPVTLRCARKSRVLSRTMTEFIIPLGATVHKCGCVITVTFFSMTFHLMLFGNLPPVGNMLVFCALLGVFAVNAPSVPGGVAVASLGIISGVLGFDASGVALLIAVFTLQDSFSTACNVTSNGALALMMDGIFNRHGELGPMQTNDAGDDDSAADAFVAPPVP